MNHLLNEEQFPAGFLPAWFEARRRHALEQAERLPEPSRRMESWRFGTPGNESLEHVEAAPPADPETLAPVIREQASMPEALRIVYANGIPVSIPEELPEGLSVMDMEDFVLQCPDTARKYLGTEMETLGSEKLSAFTTALQHNGKSPSLWKYSTSSPEITWPFFPLRCSLRKPEAACAFWNATLAQTMAANSAERSSSTIFPPGHLSNTRWFRNLTAAPVPWSFPI